MQKVSASDVPQLFGTRKFFVVATDGQGTVLEHREVSSDGFGSCEEFYEAIRSAKKELRAKHPDPAGKIHIGASGSMASLMDGWGSEII